MKADLNKILAALQQLEQNPNVSKSRPFATSNLDSSVGITSETSKAAQPDASVPIPPLQPNRQAPALPIFNSTSEENAPAEEPSLVVTTPPTLTQDLQQVVQQIESLYREGPIVDGWLESYACESTPSNDNGAVDVATPLEYVKAAGSLKQDQVICEAPRSCYRLNGVSPTGQQWSYPCPIEQLPSVSLAIARYEKLLQLLDRKQELETRLQSL